MNTISNDIIQKVKSSFTVEGAPLIKSDRFTEDEYESLKKDATSKGTHVSHFKHITANSKTWSDQEIHDQLFMFMNVNPITEDQLQTKYNIIYSSLSLIDKKKDKAEIENKMDEFMRTNNLPKFNTNFWGNFYSAPFYIDKSNKVLVDYSKKYGSCGMNEIFGSKFSDTLCTLFAMNNIHFYFDGNWEESKRLKDESRASYKSSYSDMDDMEENVTLKNSKKEARLFYMDKTKDFEERLKVFNKYGDDDNCIYHPTNKTLNNMFTAYYELDYARRHEIVYCDDVISDWVERLYKHRCRLDYTENKYHPTIKHTERGYKPSNESYERLRKWYYEKLFVEGISHFELDW